MIARQKCGCRKKAGLGYFAHLYGRSASAAQAGVFQTVSQVIHPVGGFIGVPLGAAITKLAVTIFFKVHKCSPKHGWVDKNGEILPLTSWFGNS
jgi:hypothetical protein